MFSNMNIITAFFINSCLNCRSHASHKHKSRNITAETPTIEVEMPLGVALTFCSVTFWEPKVIKNGPVRKQRRHPPHCQNKKFEPKHFIAFDFVFLNSTGAGRQAAGGGRRASGAGRPAPAGRWLAPLAAPRGNRHVAVVIGFQCFLRFL